MSFNDREELYFLISELCTYIQQIVTIIAYSGQWGGGQLDDDRPPTLTQI